MAAYRTACGKVVKFGTQLEDSLTFVHSKFGVSNSIPLAPPAVQSCTYVYVNNFWTVRVRNKILFSSDSLAHDESIAPYDVIFRHENFSAILNFLKNLLFRTPPRPLLRFSRKLNQIIFRPCWQKVMEFESVSQTVFDKHANEFYVVLAKIDIMLYLRNALSYSDQTWYMSSQAWPEATCSVSAQRHLLVRRYEKWLFLLITSDGFVQNS